MMLIANNDDRIDLATMIVSSHHHCGHFRKSYGYSIAESMLSQFSSILLNLLVNSHQVLAGIIAKRCCSSV